MTIEPFTTDDVYQSASFAVLASGMKNRDAMEIVTALLILERTSGRLVFTNFERFANEALKQPN